MNDAHLDEHGRLWLASENTPAVGNVATPGCRVAAVCAAVPLGLGGFWLFYAALLTRADPDTAALKLLRALLGAGGALVFSAAVAAAWWALTARSPRHWLVFGAPALITVVALGVAFTPFTLHLPG